ncbi:hypothetical protein [Methylocystis rosea]|uniref:hypothetical protein n=1 Tax=Methylocystis rosea TaxID=173366 RepID=UPI0012EC6DCE|nr:hypothetical protein [Methylocystis rosea]
MINFLTRRHNGFALFISCLVFMRSADLSMADNLIFHTYPLEQYSGVVVSADKDGILFDLECSGKQVKVRWSDERTPEIAFNDKCKKKLNIVIRGDGNLRVSKQTLTKIQTRCKNVGKFEIITRIGDFYVDEFSYTPGKLTAKISQQKNLSLEGDSYMYLRKIEEC